MLLGVDAAVGYDGEQLFDPVFQAGVRAAGVTLHPQCSQVQDLLNLFHCLSVKTVAQHLRLGL